MYSLSGTMVAGNFDNLKYHIFIVLTIAPQHFYTNSLFCFFCLFVFFNCTFRSPCHVTFERKQIQPQLRNRFVRGEAAVTLAMKCKYSIRHQPCKAEGSGQASCMFSKDT